MRQVVFVQMPGIGPGLTPPRFGSVADVVLAIPWLVHDAIPPRRVLNDVLTRGKVDAGMGGGTLWEPFEIDEPEYQELVAELQRRGKRPVLGRDGMDPGGQPFDVPEVPDSVQTWGDWSVYRLDLPEQHRESLRESTFEPVEGRYERWLGALWVGDLYIAMLEGRDPEWYEKPVGSLELPAEFVELLLELERVHKSWFGHRREDIPAMSEAREQADRAINDYVDRTGLPRWPFGIGAEDSQPDRPFG